jgi:hypothetical protein
MTIFITKVAMSVSILTFIFCSNTMLRFAITPKLVGVSKLPNQQQHLEWVVSPMLLLLWKMALESMLKKNSFHTRKKFRFSMTTRVRSRLAYPEDAPFSICF